MFVDGKVVKQFGVTGILALLKWTQGVKSLYSDGERCKSLRKEALALPHELHVPAFTGNPPFHTLLFLHSSSFCPLYIRHHRLMEDVAFIGCALHATDYGHNRTMSAHHSK